MEALLYKRLKMIVRNSAKSISLGTVPLQNRIEAEKKELAKDIYVGSCANRTLALHWS
jgi:hypothetical protein